MMSFHVLYGIDTITYKQIITAIKSVIIKFLYYTDTTGDTVTLLLNITVGGEVIAVILMNGSETTIATCGANETFNVTSLVCQCLPGKEFIAGYCQTPPGDVYLTIIAYISSGISLLGSIAILLTYSLFRELRRSLPGKLVMSLSVAFLLYDGFIVLSSTFRLVTSYVICDFTAIFLHYCVLCEFTWINILAVEFVRTFQLALKVQMDLPEEQKVYLLLAYSALGWGTPAITVLINVIINYTVTDSTIYGGNDCWIKKGLASFLSFFVPLFISSVLNVVLFSVVINMWCRLKRNAIGIEHSSLKQVKRKKWAQLRAILALILTLSVTWVIGLAAIMLESDRSFWFWIPYFVFSASRSYVVAAAFLLSKRVAHLYHALIKQCHRRVMAFCSRGS